MLYLYRNLYITNVNKNSRNFCRNFAGKTKLNNCKISTMTSARHAAVINELDRFLGQREDQINQQISRILARANESLLKQLETGVREIKGIDLLGKRQAMLLAAENSRLQQFLTSSETSRIESMYSSLIKDSANATADAAQELIRFDDARAGFSTVGVPAREIAVVAKSSASLLAGHGQTFARQATEAIGLGLANNQSFRGIANQIRADAGGTLSNAMTIARTEVNRANNEVMADNYNRAEIQYIVWVATVNDACTFCIGRNMQIMELKGATLPPIHPRCRCYTMPATPGTIDEKWMRRYRQQAIDRSDAEPTSRLNAWEQKAGGHKIVWTPERGWIDKTAERRLLNSPTPKVAEKPDQYLEREEARKQYKLLGSGIEGEVFRSNGDPPTAIKYTNTVKKADLIEKGMTDEMATRFLSKREEKYEASIKNIQRGGELGISPRVIGTGRARNEVGGFDRILEMEFLDGYSVGIHPPDFDGDTQPFDRKLIQRLRTAHQNNLQVADLHSENIMVNAETQDIKFIDQGNLAESPPSVIADQLLNRFGDRPLGADTIRGYIEEHGTSKQRSRYRAIQREYLDSQDEDGLTDSRYSQLIEGTYDILNELGV